MPRTLHFALPALAFFAATLAPAQPPAAPPPDTFYGHPRAVILSDIGNEPDDQMSLVRLLLYSNEIDIEGLVATTSTWQKTATHPETMRQLIAVYGQVRANLLLHASGWPTATSLDERVFSGQSAYGLAATGPGKSSPGAQALLAAALRDDPRPLWICLWGGANTLAQALMDARATLQPDALARLIDKLRVYSISDQDDAGPWIRREFPRLSYIVMPSAPDGGEYYYATWTGISGDRFYRNGEGADFSTVTNEWLDQHIRSVDPLGRVYPKYLFIMEGDTPSFLNLIDNGLAAWQRPDWGGWGGRYVFRQPYGGTRPIWTQGGDEFARVTSQDTVIGVDGREHVSDQASIWRWRTAFQNDFAARMAWTVADYAHANHPPVAVVDSKPGTAPVELDIAAGESITLDASASFDPDRQPLAFHWFHYAEAGLAGGNLAALTLTGADTAHLTVRADAPCRPLWLPLIPCKGSGVAHIILAVSDNGSPQLTSYRRVILHVHPKEN